MAFNPCKLCFELAFPSLSGKSLAQVTFILIPFIGLWIDAFSGLSENFILLYFPFEIDDRRLKEAFRILIRSGSGRPFPPSRKGREPS